MSRRVELDALRGLLLVIMAINHLPTRLRAYTDQPFGFVSAAEGFVFLSAFVTGATYSRLLSERGTRYVRARLWRRALRVYAYHIGLLLFAFTVLATIAAATGRPGLEHLLAFYFAAPGAALLGGSLLLYQPALFDILPMYVIFLAVSPALLAWLARGGARQLWLASFALWLAAQLGARSVLHGMLCRVTGVALPLDALGAFDLLAWQLLWAAGLWLGFDPSNTVAWRAPRFIIVAAALALLFTCWRHRWLGWLPVTPFVAVLLDKWHLGPLRLANFAALLVVAAHALLPALGRLRSRALAALGRASLQVFTAQLVVCVLSLSLVVDDARPSSLAVELLILVSTFVAMGWAAVAAGRSHSFDATRAEA